MKHDSVKLLLDSLERETGKRLDHSQLARGLNVSAQVITNWATRGMSVDGALAAQQAFHRDANYLLGRIPHPIMSLTKYATATPTAPLTVREPDVTYVSGPPWPFQRISVAQWMALDTGSKELVEDMISRLSPV